MSFLMLRFMKVASMSMQFLSKEGLIMIMQDYKNVKTEEKTTAWDIVGAVAFAVILISLIFLATI